MKNLQKILILAVAMTGISTASFAQTDVKTATVTASATIITPITITKIDDLNFGNIVSTTAGGTVILSPAGVRTEAGVQLPAVTGTVTAASFTVTGQDGYAYAVTLPTTAYSIATGTGSANQLMSLDTFTSNTTGTLTGGTQTLKVGATLTLVANQIAGTYIGTTPFNVSVNYN